MPNNTVSNSIKVNALNSIENLVFKGGSVKGIAYLGAMDILINQKYINLKQIKRVGGASAGAITSLLLALDKDYKQLEDLMKNLIFKELLDKGDTVEGFTLRDTFLKFIEIEKKFADKDKLKDFFIYYIWQFAKLAGFQVISNNIA